MTVGANRRVEEREIDGLVFTCQQSSFERAFPLSSRVAVLFSVEHDDVQASTLLALAAFKADPALLGDLLAGTRVVLDGKFVSLGTPADRDKVFTGRLGTAVKAALFAAEVEFRDFLGGVFAEPGEDAKAAEETKTTDAPSA